MGSGLRQNYLVDLKRVSDVMSAKVYIDFLNFFVHFSLVIPHHCCSVKSPLWSYGVKDVDRFLQHFGLHTCNKKFVSLL